MPKGNDKRKRAARAIQAETGMKYTEALREADRRYAAGQERKAVERETGQHPELTPQFREPRP